MDKHSTSPPPIHRRNATGQLDPRYAHDLRARSLEGATPKDDAVMPHAARLRDHRAEHLGAEFIGTITSGDDDRDGELDGITMEETGGPFLKTRGKTEFARGTDASNPKGAMREPFPTT
jgi:hypothetical protein